MANNIYVGSGTTNKNLIKSKDELIPTLKDLSKQASQNIVPLADKDDYKIHQAPVGYVSAFGTAKIPDESRLSINYNDGLKLGFLRKFIVLDYDLDKAYIDADKKQQELLKRIEDLFDIYNYTLYPTISWPSKPRWRFVLQIDRYLDDYSYKHVAGDVKDLIGYDTGDDNNYFISHSFNLPSYTDQTADSQAIFKFHDKDYDVKNMLADMPKPLRNPAKDAMSNITYDDTLLNQALDEFVNDPENQNKLQTYDYYWKFVSSLALASIKGLLPQDFIKVVLIKTALGNSQWEKDNPNLFKTQVKRLEDDPSKQTMVRPITSYLPLVAQVNDAKNLGQLLIRLLPPSFEANSSLPIAAAAEIISNLFEFALTPFDGKDSENVVLFNPLSGYWEHNENNFLAMINTLRPTTNRQDYNAIVAQWGAQANVSQRIIKPYSGSRYLLFKNEVLDIKENKPYALNSQKTRDLQFTRRHLINIDYKDNPSVKQYDHDGLNGTPWSIEDFVNGYTENDPDKRKYFLFILALGLLPNHNTGVNVSIQGASGSGKSTLFNIFEGLYNPSRINIIKYMNLNADFPINGYENDTTIVWVTENNESSAPLTDEIGIPFYDSFADPQMRLPVKHGSDTIIDNPPQLYVDGTQFIQANEVDTGPARRTIAFKMPVEVDKWRKTYYAEDIQNKLKDPDNLQWLVYHAIEALREMVPDYRLDNFILNLNIPEDLKIMPPIAKEWRKEIVSVDSRLQDWFESEFLPFAEVDGLMHMRVLYELYGAHYTRLNDDPKKRFMMKMPKFEKTMQKIFNEYNLVPKEAGSAKHPERAHARYEKQVSGPTKLGFDWSSYEARYVRPDSLMNTTDLDIFGHRVTGWFTLQGLEAYQAYRDSVTDNNMKLAKQ